MTASSRRSRLIAAITGLVSMLFVQVSIALAACDVAPDMQPTHAHETQAAPCHELPEGDDLCGAHCRNNDQTLDKPQIKVPPAPAAAAPLPVAAVLPVVVMVPASTAPLPPGPPPRILFRSFLI